MLCASTSFLLVSVCGSVSEDSDPHDNHVEQTESHYDRHRRIERQKEEAGRKREAVSCLLRAEGEK